MTADDIIKIITVGLIPLITAIGTAVLLVVQALNKQRSATLAADAVKIEQGNRLLALQGAEPVTVSNTVTRMTGTGDGTSQEKAADKATVTLLTKATPPPEVEAPASG